MPDKITDSPQAQAAHRRTLEERRDRLAEQFGQATVAIAEAEAAVEPKLRTLRNQVETQIASVRAEVESQIVVARAQADLQAATLEAQAKAQEAVIHADAERTVKHATEALGAAEAQHKQVVAEIEKL